MEKTKAEIEKRKSELVEIENELIILKNRFVSESKIFQETKINCELNLVSDTVLDRLTDLIESLELELKEYGERIAIKKRAIEKLEYNYENFLKQEKQKEIVDLHSKLKKQKENLLPLILSVNENILEVVETEKQLLNLNSHTEMNDYFHDQFVNPIIKFLPLFAKDRFLADDSNRFHCTRKLLALSRGLQ